MIASGSKQVLTAERRGKVLQAIRPRSLGEMIAEHKPARLQEAPMGAVGTRRMDVLGVGFG